MKKLTLKRLLLIAFLAETSVVDNDQCEAWASKKEMQEAYDAMDALDDLIRRRKKLFGKSE